VRQKLTVTVLLPQRNGARELAAVLPQIVESVAGLLEVIVIDDASDHAEIEQLRAAVAAHDAVRCIGLSRRSGTSAAITAGIEAAAGDLVAVMDCGGRYRMEDLGRLLAGLNRADLIFARPRRSGLAKFRRRLGRIPRWLLLGLNVREPDCLFWAARRESVAGLELARGMYRYVPTMVVKRGFRVAEVPVETDAGKHLTSDGPAHPFDLLSAWWHRVRSSPTMAREWTKEPPSVVPFTQPETREVDIEVSRRKSG